MVAHLSPANPRPVVPWRPRQVWIDRQVINSPVAANVLAHLPDVPTAIIDGLPAVPVPTNQAALMTSAKKALLPDGAERVASYAPAQGQRAVTSRASCAVAT